MNGQPPTVDPVDLARYIVAIQGAMSHLKLQKLLYYMEAWHLVFFNHTLINEDFKAWVHGPVCIPVWHNVKEHSQLNGRINLLPPAKKAIIAKVESRLSKSQIQFIKDVLVEYGDKTAYHLECLTHNESPWLEARGNLPEDEPSFKRISKTTMKSFYKSMLSSRGKASK